MVGGPLRSDRGVVGQADDGTCSAAMTTRQGPADCGAVDPHGAMGTQATWSFHFWLLLPVLPDLPVVMAAPVRPPTDSIHPSPDMSLKGWSTGSV
jgi:hypothetical protein